MNHHFHPPPSPSRPLVGVMKPYHVHYTVTSPKLVQNMPPLDLLLIHPNLTLIVYFKVFDSHGRCLFGFK